jgi:hypothetical protein
VSSSSERDAKRLDVGVGLSQWLSCLMHLALSVPMQIGDFGPRGAESRLGCCIRHLGCTRISDVGEDSRCLIIKHSFT